MRAPEVFLGQACTGQSQVWAVAAMLLCWIKPNVLGNADSPHPLVDAAWCMAKINRLFPDWDFPTPDEVEGPVLQAAVKAAKRMSQEDSPMQAILPIKEEMQKVEMPQQLRDLLVFMLVINPDKRPSASAVLASKEFLAFEKVEDA
jgi:serine/threonine protein kinase